MRDPELKSFLIQIKERPDRAPDLIRGLSEFYVKVQYSASVGETKMLAPTALAHATSADCIEVASFLALEALSTHSADKKWLSAYVPVARQLLFDLSFVIHHTQNDSLAKIQILNAQDDVCASMYWPMEHSTQDLAQRAQTQLDRISLAHVAQMSQAAARPDDTQRPKI